MRRPVGVFGGGEVNVEPEGASKTEKVCREKEWVSDSVALMIDRWIFLQGD